MPKPVALTHEMVLSRLEWQWATFPFHAGDVCCFKTALTFVDAVAEIFAPLLRGVPTVVLPKAAVRDPPGLLGLLAEGGVTRLVLVPSLLKVLVDCAKTMAERNDAVLNTIKKRLVYTTQLSPFLNNLEDTRKTYSAYE